MGWETRNRNLSARASRHRSASGLTCSSRPLKLACSMQTKISFRRRRALNQPIKWVRQCRKLFAGAYPIIYFTEWRVLLLAMVPK